MRLTKHGARAGEEALDTQANKELEKQRDRWLAELDELGKKSRSLLIARMEHLRDELRREMNGAARLVGHDAPVVVRLGLLHGEAEDIVRLLKEEG